MLRCSLSLGESIVEDINRVAKGLYMMHGEAVTDNFKFYQARSDLAKRCWSAAVVAYINSVYIDGMEIEATSLAQVRKLIQTCSLRCANNSTISC